MPPGNKSLDDLQRERNTLENEIRALKAEIDDLKTKQHLLDVAGRAQQALKAAESKRAPKSELTQLRRAVDDAEKNVEPGLQQEQVKTDIEKKVHELADKREKRTISRLKSRRRLISRNPNKLLKRK